MSGPTRPLWIETHRLRAGEAPDVRWDRPLTGLPTEDQLAQALTALDAGPTAWILDDLYVPSILLRDVVELPEGTEARESFWRWKFQQSMALEAAHSVQALLVEPGLWLVAGSREAWRDARMTLSQRLEAPSHPPQPPTTPPPKAHTPPRQDQSRRSPRKTSRPPDARINPF